MATITGTIDKPDGSPAAGWNLRIELLADNPLIASEVIVPADITLTLDNTGSFSVDLIATSDYDVPAPYRFTFTDPTTKDKFVLIKDVPTSDANIRDLTLTASLPSGYVTPQMLKVAGDLVDGKVLAIAGTQFVQVDNTGSSSGVVGVRHFVELVDVPNAYNGQQGKTLIVNELETALEFADKPDTYLQLDDTIDSNYRGKAFMFPSVSAGEDELELRHLDDQDIPAGIARDTEIDPKIASWARTGNTDDIPTDKLTNAPAGSGSTVQPSNAVPQRVGASGNAGSLGTYARGDHRHQSKAIQPSEVPVSIARKTDIASWAIHGNSDDIPDSKISNDFAKDDEIEPFAKVALRTATIPNQKIADDSLTPAKLNADTVAEKQAFRRKINAAAEGTVSVPFHDVITFTVGTALDGEHRGFDSDVAGSYGSTTDPLTFEANNITYQVRQCDQDGTQVEVTITPDPPADAKWAFSINGHSLKMQDAVRINSLEYGTDGDLFQWNNQSRDVIPANGQTFEFIVGNAIDDELARVEAGIVANRPEVMDDRHVEGLAVGNVNNSQKDALHALRPIYTLGTSPDSIFLCEIQAGITSGTNLSFEDYGQRSAVIFSKSISAANAYATLTNEGVLLGEWKILQGTGAGTEIGTLSAYIVKNNDDQIGWYMDWNAGSGGDGTAAGFQVTASVARLQTR